ncbi:hypothetical protein ACEQ8H_007021 [Pleosporales sp. CAS-2024a]
MSPANRGWLQQGMIRGHMLGKNLLPGDEELGKKDDDHRFVPVRPSAWSIWNHTFRWRRRRTLLVVTGLALLYMAMNSVGGAPPATTTAPRYDAAPSYEHGLEPSGPPPGRRPAGSAPSRTFDGRIRFYRLGESLRASAVRTNGYATTNQNVLFAMASLKSVATLLPLACDMSKYNRNFVHVAFMGREDMSIQRLLDINGVDRDTCTAIWHDARPDFLEYSSDARAQAAVAEGLVHIQSMVHPQAVIVDDSLSEDDHFVRGIRSQTAVLDVTLIEVPKGKWEKFMWITRLDAASLRQWHSPTVDILIQVPPESSSVLRLLKSIKGADYDGLRPPRIILELPVQLDASVEKKIESFQWPPNDAHPRETGGLIVRRRIHSRRSTQEDAAVRFLELFYPASATKSHVLLLSPQTQLSPLYYHYVKYALLEYKFSSFSAYDSTDLLGVSLELPRVLLDGKTKLTPPKLDDMYTTRHKKLFPKTAYAPFLWQAPNSHATLFFGDKWAELHSFLTNRVLKQHESAKTTSRAKAVSEALPAWTEYMLEYMRARAYTVLYPAKTSEAFVTVHNELYHAPEEYSPGPEGNKEHGEPARPEPFLRAEHAASRPKQDESQIIPDSQSLHLVLPFDGDLPELGHLPHLLYNGEMIDKSNVSSTALEYANQFRREIGGCTKKKHRNMAPGQAKDLFCWGDDDDEERVSAADEATWKAMAMARLNMAGGDEVPEAAMESAVDND